MSKKSWILGSLVIMTLVLITATLIVMEIIAFQDNAINKLAYENVIETRKQLLKSNVEHTINSIELIKDDMLVESQLKLNFLVDEIALNIITDDYKPVATNEYEEIINEITKTQWVEEDSVLEKLEILIYDTSKDTVVFSNPNNKNLERYLIDYEASSVKYDLQLNGIKIYTYISDVSIELMTKERSEDWIRDLRVEGSEYLWVNEVINYDGGHDYGIRLVHPNLPDTEGILLSTETQDIKGNKPYKTELEGINANGEVYLRYYFKEYESDHISEKLTYGKLYEPYDWIIATGIYINDIVELDKAEMLYNKSIPVVRTLLIISVIVFSLLVIVIVKIINRLTLDKKKQKEEFVISNDEMKDKLAIVEDMAYKDSLTKILNRRGAFERLEEEISRHRRQKYDLVVSMLDVDYFKNINDTYGHDVGDKALIHVAQIISKHIRKEDIIARIGGDEFLCIMPYAKSEDASKIARNIRNGILNDCLIYKEVKICMSVSIGITKVLDTDNVDSIIKRADIAMYQSKRAGRNFISKN